MLPTFVGYKNMNHYMSKRLSSYQRLKIENDRLRQDIYNLVRNSDSVIGIMTKKKYDVQYQLEDELLGGSTDSKSFLLGMFPHLNNNPK